jgi:hypothetical protein
MEEPTATPTVQGHIISVWSDILARQGALTGEIELVLVADSDGRNLNMSRRRKVSISFRSA